MKSRIHFISPRERILYLKSIPFLSALGSKHLLELAEFANERTFRSGQELIKKDKPIQAAHLLVSGKVNLLWDGKQVLEVEAPRAVGVLGILARVERGIEAIAVEETRTLEISVQHLLRAYENNSRLILASIQGIVGQILELRNGLPADPDSPPSVDPGKGSTGPLSFVDQLLGYRRLPLFRGANLDAVAELCHQQSERRWQPGDVIWRRGQASTSNLQIIHGVVSCDPEDGRKPMRIGSNYTLGIESLSDRPRGYTLTAETEVVCLETDVEVFLSLVEDHFELAMSMAASIARMLMRVRGSAVLDPPKLSFTDKPLGEFYSQRAPRTIL